MVLQYIIPPIVGAVIGYITNDIAIKMLFHPRRAHYIGKHQIPFTPGLIPKEKARIAKSLGNMVSVKLLNGEVIAKTLTSEEVVLKLRERLYAIVDHYRNDTRTVDEFMLKFGEREDVDKKRQKVIRKSASYITDKITNANLGEVVGDIILKKAKEKLEGNFIARLLDTSIVTSFTADIARNIDDMVSENAYGVIYKMIENEADTIQSTGVNLLIEKIDYKIPDLIEDFITMYKKLVNENMQKIVSDLNIAGVIETQINNFSTVELETMILDVMNKELKAIVYLGALLGFLMGFRNIALIRLN